MSLSNKETAKNSETIVATAAKMVIKSNGESQEFSVEKLKKRVSHLLEGLSTEYMAIDQCIDKVAKYAQSGKFNNLKINSIRSCSIRYYLTGIRQLTGRDCCLLEHAPPRLW